MSETEQKIAEQKKQIETLKNLIEQLQQKEMYDRFVKYGVTNVLIDHSSADFVEMFGHLFDEDAYAPMGEVGITMVSYYEVEYTEDGGMFFNFVEGGVVDYD